MVLFFVNGIPNYTHTLFDIHMGGGRLSNHGELQGAHHRGRTRCRQERRVLPSVCRSSAQKQVPKAKCSKERTEQIHADHRERERESWTATGTTVFLTPSYCNEAVICRPQKMGPLDLSSAEG